MQLGDAMKKLTFFSLFTVSLTVMACVWFFFAISKLSKNQELYGKKQLEEAIRQAAVSCYASEGIYPPSISYLEEHYGIQIDKKHYNVFYEIYGENLIPEITVLEKK